jgi:hypothetical protein
MVVVLFALAVQAMNSGCEVFVAPYGSDIIGMGTIGSPFATPQYALDVIEMRVHDCRPATISFRSGVFELESTLKLSGTTFDHLEMRTYHGDLQAGRPAAVLSGGKRLPANGAGMDGVYRADLRALGVRTSDPPDRIFTLFVSGQRRQRVRSKLLHWNHSISSHDPCESCEINRYGFVFGAGELSWLFKCCLCSQCSRSTHCLILCDLP